MKKSLVSVIIPTYSRPIILLRAVNSVLNQTYPNIEIIVIDDNGRESEFQKNNEILLSTYIAEGAIKYIVLKENQGACNARNQGTFNACGEYLFFLDDDDEFLQDKLAHQIDFLDTNPTYDAHISAMIRLDSQGKEIISIENIPRGADFVSFAVDGNFFTPMMAIRRNVFLELDGFSEIPRFQDQYFMCKLLASGYKVKMDSVPLYIMHEHNENRITNISVEKSLISLNMLNAYKYSHRSLFNPEQWNRIETKYLVMKAMIFFTNRKYANRLKSFPIYVILFMKNPSLSRFRMLFRSLLPF
jgi:glycosyltransferase involved in cell wall biosynthesis